MTSFAQSCFTFFSQPSLFPNHMRKFIKFKQNVFNKFIAPKQLMYKVTSDRQLLCDYGQPVPEDCHIYMREKAVPTEEEEGSLPQVCAQELFVSLHKRKKPCGVHSKRHLSLAVRFSHLENER